MTSPVNSESPASYETQRGDGCHPLILISSPAGAGKTTLLSQFIAGRQGQVTWLQSNNSAVSTIWMNSKRKPDSSLPKEPRANSRTSL
jgi:ABC-type iron transport system FetAB ATPase subunit